MKLLNNLILEMKRTINAQIVADSMSPQGHRITTYLLTYPRFIHAELMTHRMFSRNSASSRAIPFKRMLQMVEEDPFIPIAWIKDHSGMQGNEYFTNKDSIEQFTTTWLEASKYAAEMAEELNSSHIMDYNNPEDKRGLTKQLCNRLLEAFMWHTTLVTATELKGFFELRCPKYTFGSKTDNPKSWRSKKDAIKDFPDWITRNDLFWYSMNESQAEIHIQALAESMLDAMNESTPKELQPNEWHIPDFGLHKGLLEKYISDYFLSSPKTEIKIAVAHCAKLSYNNHGNSVDFAKDIKLHNQLLASHHMSPFEHVARVMSDDEYDSFFRGRTYVNQNEPNSKELNNFYIENGHGWCNNFKGFIQYRYLIENNYDI